MLFKGLLVITVFLVTATQAFDFWQDRQWPFQNDYDWGPHFPEPEAGPYFPEPDPYVFRHNQPVNVEVKTHIPRNGESYSGSSSYTSSYSRNVNGKEESGGISETIINDNGKIERKVQRW